MPSMIAIRQHTPEDRKALLQPMTELQGHVAALDSLHRLKTIEDFDAEAYVDHLLLQMEKEHGVILIAKEEDAVIGFVVGSIPPASENDNLDHYPAIEGKIDELVVSEKHRGKHVGLELIRELEQHFQKNGCEFIRVGCFAPNVGTHAFYEKCGYNDRYIEMLKKID